MQIGYTIIMYNALLLLHDLIKSRALAKTWPFIDKLAFFMVILDSTHSLWIELLHWYEETKDMSLVYKPAVHVLRTCGASPCSRFKPSSSIDSTMHTWFHCINHCFFPGSVLDQTQVFTDNRLLAW